jgi:hypothetical protein
MELEWWIWLWLLGLTLCFFLLALDSRHDRKELEKIDERLKRIIERLERI